MPRSKFRSCRRARGRSFQTIVLFVSLFSWTLEDGLQGRLRGDLRHPAACGTYKQTNPQSNPERKEIVTTEPMHVCRDKGGSMMLMEEWSQQTGAICSTRISRSGLIYLTTLSRNGDERKQISFHTRSTSRTLIQFESTECITFFSFTFDQGYILRCKSDSEQGNLAV